jgi:hypothetical protein
VDAENIAHEKVIQIGLRERRWCGSSRVSTSDTRRHQVSAGRNEVRVMNRAKAAGEKDEADEEKNEAPS